MAYVMPFVDLTLAFLVHLRGMERFHPLRCLLAVSSLSIFTLIVARWSG